MKITWSQAWAAARSRRLGHQDGLDCEKSSETILCLAVIRNAKLGYDYDYGGLSLRFSTYVDEAFAAGQGLSLAQTQQAFLDTKAPNVEWFNGHTCWVEYNGPTIKYVRMFKYL